MRSFALKHPYLVLMLFIVITMVFAYGNIKVKKGGVLDNALTDKNDPYYKMDQRIGEFFPGSEKMIFAYMDAIDSIEDLQEIDAMTKKLESYIWAQGRVLSLSTVPNFKIQNDEMTFEPFVNSSANDNNIDEFKKAVKDNNVVYGKLIGENFDWALIVVFLAREHNQEKVYWDTVELLEGKKISWWQKWLRYDIHPKDSKWGVASWVVGRETIDLVARFDIFKIIILLGLPIIFLVFLFSLGSWQQAIISVSAVALSLWWTRGTIWALDSLGWQFNEKVYILLTYANNIVQGSSFCLHKFHAFQKQGSWQKAQIVDRLILITGGISSGGLLTLYTFKVLTIREMGVLSAFGIAYMVLFSIFLLPAMYASIVRKKETIKQSNLMQKISLAKWLEKISRACGSVVIKHANLILAGSGMLVVLAIVLVFLGFIIVGTKPLAFIHHTHVWKICLWLNQTVGFDEVELMIEPKAIVLASEHVLYNPKFIAQADAFEKEILEIQGATVSLSVLNSLARISSEFYNGRQLPESEAESSINLMQLESSAIGKPILDDLYNNQAIKLSIFTNAADDSINLRRFWAGIQKLAQEKYPDLQIAFGGKTFLWSLQDKYISYGKPLNVLTSELWVFLICCLMIFSRNKQLSFRALKPIRTGIIMAVPLFFATVCIVIIMAVFKIRLDQANAVIMAMAIGASIDFSIYFVDAFQEARAQKQNWPEAVQYASQTKGPIIVTDAVLNTLGFLPLALSSFGPVAMLGWLTAAMLIFSAIGSLLVMPCLLRYSSSKK